MRLTLPPRTAQIIIVALGLAALLSEGIGARPAWGQDELFVANSGNNSITVYPRTASGNTAPIRRLAGAATGLNDPFGLVVDTVNNELVVADFNNHSIMHGVQPHGQRQHRAHPNARWGGHGVE